MKPSHLGLILASHQNNEKQGITFIKAPGREKYLSYRSLYWNALAVCQKLQDLNIKACDRVILQVSDQEKYLTLFWACLLGNMLAAPLTVGNNEEHHIKLRTIWQTLDHAFLICEQKQLQNIAAAFEDQYNSIAQRIILAEDLVPADMKVRENSAKPDLTHSNQDHAIAYLQFSSGSTGIPRGVILTHANLITNIEGIIQSARFTRHDSFLSWMPLTHDMGLIGFHLVPLVLGVQQYLMPTTLFIRRPFHWLDRASHYQATILSSPNFGYNYFLKFFGKMDCKGWDLSSIRLIFNGAEPISAALCERFLNTLAPLGLKKNSMFTVYGLAEASLAVAFPPVNELYQTVWVDRNQMNIGQPVVYCEKGHRDSVEFVIVGRAVTNTRLRIVDESHNVLPGHNIGLIEIKGDNVTSGYYNNEPATREIMSTAGWLNTGDLGFIKEGALIVTGRAKDIIFLGGQNFYAHDLERIAEKVAGIELGTVACGGVFNHEQGEDELVFFVLYKKETLEEFAGLIHELKKMVNKETGLKLSHIIPVRRIPKTTSGKVKRYQLLNQFRSGEYDEIVKQLSRLIDSRMDQDAIHMSPNLENNDSIQQFIRQELEKLLGLLIFKIT